MLLMHNFFVHTVRLHLLKVRTLNFVFRAHKATRVVVERAIGVLKRRFPRLDNRLQYDPVTCGKIIVACVMLHNFAISHGDEWNENVEVDDVMDDVEAEENGDENGARTRNAYIQRHFTNN